jgi:hypothetical protein
MSYPTLKEIREDFVKNDIWELSPEIAKILNQQIKALPYSDKLSEYEYRYPKDKAGVRGFLDKFFARHFFQVQHAILQEDTYERFLNAINRGRVQIADIGCGPALATIATLNIISYICNKHSKFVDVSVILNDTETENLVIGQKMLTRYAKQLRKIRITKTISLDTPFPDSMVQLRRISKMTLPYDMCFMSYIFVPLKEDASYDEIGNQIQELATHCKPDGFGILIQDKFRENHTRRLGAVIKATVNKLTLNQKVYDSNNSNENHWYNYFRMVFFPDRLI